MLELDYYFYNKIDDLQEIKEDYYQVNDYAEEIAIEMSKEYKIDISTALYIIDLMLLKGYDTIYFSKSRIEPTMSNQFLGKGREADVLMKGTNELYRYLDGKLIEIFTSSLNEYLDY